MKKYINGQYIELTPEEISAMEAESRRANLIERSRPLSTEEVARMVITNQINSLSVDDNTALRMKNFYPDWKSNTAYETGFKVQRKDKLWRVRQSHTSQTGWEPENVESLWEQINESHDGTEDDPIPYSGNMALSNGLYYTQDYEIFRCTRDTVNPVYNALSELLGLYVEKI